ncbi:hypothetical protein [Flavobacterium reichenbachii]|uniref:DUF4932 domain-containing protein n=1 Tax=Flavobacterium reichenbachii TaxID=362418 RepID=A0A085ZJL5_9FLAO|nr:hypothetical protein [Flavobacterium reichenbachii]KFF04629.1 hypothetical protein IW19_03370 [Flavobacterium reichenbachii]OXB09824.1 hypothetical protein B0A68_23060 [Flavobacterium reichenbachii]
MKKRFLTAFLLASTLAFTQTAKFKIKYSEQLAVLIFLENLSENYPENVYKTEFIKSSYNTEKYKNLISEFDKLSFGYSYRFEEFPYGSKKSVQTEDLSKKNLIETENLTEFKIRSIGIIPNKTLNDLAEIISEFTPIYKELIYNPNKEKFEKQLQEIIKYSDENHIENYFETGLRFYNSSWDNSVPFVAAFYPLPNSKGFTAQSFCNNFISAVQTDLKSYKDLFSVMLHETYHIIYDEQSLKVKTEINNYFKANKSKCSNYAYLLMNEVLATALGNGYVYAALDGKIDSRDWYYKKYINLMAKQIYPLVKEYIDQKKSIDQNFIDNYIKSYEVNFPNWINELDNIMTYRYVISENENDLKVINKMFRYRSKTEYENKITENSIEKMQQTPLTKVIVISKNSNEILKLLKHKFSELKNWKPNGDKEFADKILLNDKSQLILLNQKKSTIESLINSIK